MTEPIAYLRDLDGTGSFHVCAKGDSGYFPVFALAADVMLRKLGQIRKLALAAEGHRFDLVIALADEALAAGSRRAEPNLRSSQSEGCQSGPKGNAQPSPSRNPK